MSGHQELPPVEDMDVLSPQPMATDAHKHPEQLPSIVKSHLPPHLTGFGGRKPTTTGGALKDSTAITGNTAAGGGHQSTPAVVKRRQLGKWFNSPTDAFLSPCTQKLMKPKHDGPPAAIGPLDLDEKLGTNAGGGGRLAMDAMGAENN